MVNQVISALIAGVVGAVAFIAVRALVIGAGLAPCGNTLACDGTTGNITGSCGSVLCLNGTEGVMCNGTYSGANNTVVNSNIECWAGVECTLMVTILPLVIAIVTVATLFMALTRVRGA